MLVLVTTDCAIMNGKPEPKCNQGVNSKVHLTFYGNVITFLVESFNASSFEGTSQSPYLV